MKSDFYGSLKATMTVVGTLAMLGSVCTINFDRNLALAMALAGGFTLAVEKLVPSPKEEEEVNKTDVIEHKFQTYDLIKRGPRKTW